MDRKDFYQFGSKIGWKTALRHWRALDPYNGRWTQKQAVHLLRRLLFGVKKVDVDKVLSQG